MLCENCKQRLATVHITRIINNQKTQFNLCEECARNYHQQWSTEFFTSEFSLPKFLANLVSPEAVSFPPKFSRAYRCEGCGLTYEQFQQLGKFGCGQCYHAFEPQVETLLRRIHGASSHRGKVPRRTGGELRLRQEIERLKAELNVLVANEEFERAAEVRDKIKALEKKLA